MSWCKSIINHKVPEKEIKNRLHILKQFGKNTYHGEFTAQWVKELLKEIDKLWYEGKLLPSLSKHYRGLIIKLKIPEHDIGAYVQESPNQDNIYLCVNRSLFNMLFKRDESAYHAGGLLCTDPFDCLMHVLLHESVHLVLTLCDKLGYRDDTDHHGKEFEDCLFNLFRQTDIQHGLIPGMNQKYSLKTMKKKLKPGQKVQYPQRLCKNKDGSIYYHENTWKDTRILKIKGHIASLDDGYDIHLGMLRIKHN